MPGIRQEALAYELGEDGALKKVALLKQRETIETDILAQVATVLKILVEAMENRNDDMAIHIITNTFNIEKNDGGYLGNSNSGFVTTNPIEEIRQLHQEKIALFERMLQEKDEMIARLDQLIQEKTGG